MFMTNSHMMLSYMTGMKWAFIFTLLTSGLMACDHNSQGWLREPDAVGGPTLLRRITESQYRSSIAAIFGPEVPVLGRFERPLRAHGLIAVGTSEAGLSPFAMEQYDIAAQGVADFILTPEHRADYLPCIPEVSIDVYDVNDPCVEQFIEHYGLLLFRRPLSQDQRQRYLNIVETGAQRLGDVYQGLRYALVGMMTAPEFLLRIERAIEAPNDPSLPQLDSWSKAARLSYFLTDTTPDLELLRAAENGQLNSAQGLQKQVDRLLASPQFESALRAFFRDMLEFELFDDLAKDTEIYPAFNSDVVADAQEQTLRDIIRTLVAEEGDYRDLFTLTDSEMTRSLGVLYRQPVASRDGWERVPLSNDGRRLGIQSHISFLALHAHPGRSSPTLRGEALRNIFLCQEVPDPPPDVNFSAVQDAASTVMPTARDRLSAHNTEPACAGCHKVMDPLGLALEHYDGLGMFRVQENSAPIDASGSLDGVDYDDAHGLAQALSRHPETPRCLVEKLYRFGVGRDTVWDERAYMDYLIAKFEAHGFRVPELMRTIALSNNFFAVSPSVEHGDDTQWVIADASDRSEG